MTNEEFEQTYYPRYDSVLKQLARKLARRDQALYEDLYQAGLIALWQLDTGRVHSNEDAWVRQSIYNKMVDLLRKERPIIFESLEQHLEAGNQLVYDVDTDGPRLYDDARARRRQPPEEPYE